MIFGIYVSELNGTNVKPMVPGRSTSPSSIALHPARGYVSAALRQTLNCVLS